MIRKPFIALSFMVLLACVGQEGSKSYQVPMGFSTWPWDATTEAVDWTYDKIQENGHIVSHHIEEGVPWTEAILGTIDDSSQLEAFRESVDFRASQTHVDVVLQLNPLDITRSHLAPFRTSEVNAPLTAPWSNYALNHDNVKAAYLNYVEWMARKLNPQYIQTGIEVNILRAKAGLEKWQEYVDLQCHVYNSLKAHGFIQPIGVSLFSVAYYHPDLYATEYNEEEQVQALRDIEPCVDLVAWSVHPFISGLFAEDFPDDYFTVVFNKTRRHQAVSESSYPAQEWSIPSVGTWRGTPEKQRDFLEKLILSSKEKYFRYLIWYAVRDFDQFWLRPVNEGGLGSDSLSLLWRDTGLFDENGDPRTAFDLWGQHL